MNYCTGCGQSLDGNWVDGWAVCECCGTAQVTGIEQDSSSERPYITPLNDAWAELREVADAIEKQDWADALGWIDEVLTSLGDLRAEVTSKAALPRLRADQDPSENDKIANASLVVPVTLHNQARVIGVPIIHRMGERIYGALDPVTQKEVAYIARVLDGRHLALYCSVGKERPTVLLDLHQLLMASIRQSQYAEIDASVGEHQDKAKGSRG